MLFAEVSDSVLVAVIMACGTIFAACLAAVGIIVPLWIKIKEVKTDVNAVHTIVNSQKTGMQEEIDGLRRLIMQSMTDRAQVPVGGMVKVDERKAETIAAAIATPKAVDAPKKSTVISV